MSFKNKSKRLLRYLVGTRENETFGNALDRKKTKIAKKINKEKYTKEDLRNELIKAGLESGNSVLVHCSWRKFYNFEGKPEDVINVIEDILGEDGTLLMPSYGESRHKFDVNYSPSKAGVLSETFRKQPKTKRSECTHFSVAARGKYAEDLTKYHFKSEYGFDENSPMYLLTKYNNSKILFLGLSSRPTTISLFHCAGYLLKEKTTFLSKKVFTDKYNAELIIDHESYAKDMIIRNSKYKNNKKIFLEIFDSIQNKKQLKISNLDVVCFDAKEGLDKAIKFTKNGKFCYKYNYFA